MTYPEKLGGSLSEPVLCWRDGTVARIRFNRPAALNAIDVRMAQQFRQGCERIAGDATVRAVVISGEGRAFMAGGDLAAMSKDPRGTAVLLIEGMHAGIEILSQLPAPVIASVHGSVAGGGLGLALACDLCIAAEGTRFKLAYPEVGASSDCGTSWALQRLVGLRKALEIALLTEPIDAFEAQRLGLVNRVVPIERLHHATEQMAQRLATGAAQALAQLKRLLRESGGRELPAQLNAEAEGFIACSATPDFREGIQAFLDKRRPQFGSS